MSAQPPVWPEPGNDALARSDDRIQRALEWIAAHWRTNGADPESEVCGDDGWEVGYPALLYLWDPPERGAAAPYFPVTCRACGNTKLLNGITAGLVDDDETR
jgi:hypothetical protein